MVKPLTFKGDKKPKKRKRAAADDPSVDSKAAATTSASASTTQADPDNEAADDTWVSAEAVTDVVGPVMFVLPTTNYDDDDADAKVSSSSSTSPCALACDAYGKVFALPIENMVEGNPATAEPHDVRQVWVANRVAGTEQFRFKGHHGRYLACEGGSGSSSSGHLSATSEAVSPLESFTVVPSPDTPGTFLLQTVRETFVGVKQPDASASTAKTSSGSSKPGTIVRADATEASYSTTLRIRMQARFKPKIKASKADKAKEKISRKELEEAVGRRLEEDEVRTLKRARREGDYHERLLEVKIKGKHDKYS